MFHPFSEPGRLRPAAYRCDIHREVALGEREGGGAAIPAKHDVLPDIARKVDAPVAGIDLDFRLDGLADDLRERVALDREARPLCAADDADDADFDDASGLDDADAGGLDDSDVAHALSGCADEAALWLAGASPAPGTEKSTRQPAGNAHSRQTAAQAAHLFFIRDPAPFTTITN